MKNPHIVFVDCLLQSPPHPISLPLIPLQSTRKSHCLYLQDPAELRCSPRPSPASTLSNPHHLSGRRPLAGLQPLLSASLPLTLHRAGTGSLESTKCYRPLAFLVPLPGFSLSDPTVNCLPHLSDFCYRLTFSMRISSSWPVFHLRPPPTVMPVEVFYWKML